jgi:hypothetical protein
MNLNIDQFFRHYLPIIIGLGVLLLITTFLGPAGVLLALFVLGAIVYYLVEYVRKR